MFKKLRLLPALVAVGLLFSVSKAGAVPIVNPSEITDSLMHGAVRMELAVTDSALAVSIYSTTDVIVGLRVIYDDGSTAGDPTVTRTFGLTRITSSAGPQVTSFGFGGSNPPWQLDFQQDFAALPTGGVIELDTQWGSIDKVFVEPYRFEIAGAVPEPSAALLFMMGALGVGRVTRQRCRA